MSWVFIIFCFISTFSWEVGGRGSSLRNVLTPQLCLSWLTIWTISVLILTESLLWPDRDADPYLLQYSSSSIHWSDTSCATGRQSDIRPQSPTICNGFMMGGLGWPGLARSHRLWRSFMHLLSFLCFMWAARLSPLHSWQQREGDGIWELSERNQINLKSMFNSLL